MSAKHESGLSRWARRKAAVRDGRDAAATKRGAALPTATVEADPPQVAPERPAAAAADRMSEKTDIQEKALPDNLPDIETLDYDSDYAGFLSKDVSDAVRNIALRKLWRSNPLLANVDGLVDYDDDFTDAATVIEGMKSAYKVGRGMVQDDPEEAEETTALAEDGSEPQEDDRKLSASEGDGDDKTAQQAPETQSDDEEAPQDALAEDVDGKKTDDAS